MRKRVLALVALASLCAAAWAEGGAEGARKGPVTITFVRKNTTLPAAYEQIFALFKSKTGNTVEIQALPSGEEYGQLLMTRFATKDYPDAFEMDPGPKQNTKFRAEDTLYEWTNDKILDRLVDSSRDFAKQADGKIYGIPWGATNSFGVYYNKDIFAKIGAREPQSYAELLDICRKAKAGGFIPIYEAVKTGWPPQIFSLASWVTWVDPAIGDDGVAKLTVNQLRFTEIPAFKQVLQRQVQLKTLGYYQDNVLAGTYDEQQDMFGQGKVAMIFQLTGVLPLLRQKFGPDFVENKVGWFPIPGESSPGIACLSPGGQIMVPKDKPNVAVSTDLVRFMTEKDSLDIWYKVNPGIPIFKEATSVLLPAQEQVLELAKAGKARINLQNRITSSFPDYPKILQQLFIDGDVDNALKLLDENYRRTGKARQLPGF
jgi:raffinose/stachyose/melibiose transport system substrate-binding protein